MAYGKKCVHDVSGPNSYLGNTRSASKISQILSIYLRSGCHLTEPKIICGRRRAQLQWCAMADISYVDPNDMEGAIQRGEVAEVLEMAARCGIDKPFLDGSVSGGVWL